MDRDTAVARLQEKFGFRTDLVGVMQNALQEMQEELERGATLPDFLLAEDQVITITPAVPASAAPQEYTLPTGFIHEADERDGGQLRWQAVSPGPSVYIQKMDYVEAEQFFFSSQRAFWNDGIEIIEIEDTHFAPGVPIAYVLRKDTFRIYPGPDIVYNLLWSFYKHDVNLAGANTNLNRWLNNTPWLLIGKAGMHLAGSTLRDADAFTYFQKMYEDASKTGLARLIERERADRQYSLGARL